MKQIINELEKLDKDIRETEKKLSESEGRQKALLESLEKDFGVTTLKETDEKISALRKELSNLESEITTDYQKLKEDYEF